VDCRRDSTHIERTIIMTQYKPYYRSKPVTVQARKEKRYATIMTIAVVIFTAFAMLGIGFAFSVLVRYVTSMIL